MAARYECGSILLTSNQGLVDWGRTWGDEVAATALLDRLLHHSQVITIQGDSYRLRTKRRAGMVSSRDPVPTPLSPTCSSAMTTPAKSPIGATICSSGAGNSRQRGPSMSELAIHCFAKQNRFRIIKLQFGEPVPRYREAQLVCERIGQKRSARPSYTNTSKLLTRTQRLRFHTDAFSIATTRLRKFRLG